MRRYQALLVITCLALPSASAAQRAESRDEKAARMAWWREARFGMFIHWGVYSVPAGVYHGEPVSGIGEWIMHAAKIPAAEYRQYASQFNPVKYDPDAWVRLAREAGMKYVVITSKHHDGFALFDSQVTTWDVVDATPYGRDLLRPLAEACQRHGLRLGFYYSQAQDWNHPGGAAMGGHWDKAQDGDMDAYIRDIAAPQVREVLTKYGPVAVLWWDTPVDMTKARADELLPLLDLQAGIIQNNRLGGGYSGDTETPEQFIPPTGFPDRDWETCMTMNDTWGFKSADANWKSAETLIRNLVDIASKGGNYLLNVGPTPEGLIPEPSVERLKAIGRWMNVNHDAIYATQASPFKALPWGRCTMKPIPGGHRLYFHVFDWPRDGRLVVPGIQNEARQAFLLSAPQAGPLPVSRKEDALVVQAPTQPPDPVAGVVVVDVQGRLDICHPPTFASETRSFVDALEVTLQSTQAGVEIRYTLDGSEPAASSPRAEGPLRLTATTTVSARVFRGARPVSATAQRLFEQVEPRPAETVAGLTPGLRYAYFEGDWEKLPDFTALRPVVEGTTTVLGLSLRRRDDRFGLVFEGFVRAPKTGMYVFATESDDGSRLLVGGQPIVVNDGQHAMQEESGEIALAAGLHSLRVEFFERGGDQGLAVSYRGPAISKQPIPAADLASLR